MKFKLILIACFCFLFIQIQNATATIVEMGIYVTNSLSSTVTVIDPATHEVIDTLDVGASPIGIVALPDASAVYVANSVDDTVSVIDTSDNTVDAETIAVGGTPYGLAVSPDGSTVYVTNEFDNSVSVIDTATKTVTSTITAVGVGPQAIVVNPAGTLAYVANQTDNTISILDLSDNTVTEETIALEANCFPRGLAMSHDGVTLYISGNGTNKLYAMSTSDNTVSDSVDVGTGPLGVVVSDDDSTVYVVNSGDNTVSQVSVSTFEVTDTLTATNNPRFGVLSTDQSTLYVTEQSGNTVSVIDVLDDTKTSIVADEEPTGIAFARFDDFDPENAVTITAEFDNVDVDLNDDGKLLGNGNIELTVVVENLSNDDLTDATFNFVIEYFDDGATSAPVGYFADLEFEEINGNVGPIACTSNDNFDLEDSDYPSATFDMTCDIETLSAGQTRTFFVEVTDFLYPAKTNSLSVNLTVTATFTSGEVSESADANLGVVNPLESSNGCSCRLGAKPTAVGTYPIMVAVVFLLILTCRRMAVQRQRKAM